jgi:hypothetical protein
MAPKYAGPLAFIDALIAALKADATVNAAVTSKFPGEALRYFIGVDPEKLPEAENCPFLAFMPGDYGLSSAGTYRTLAVKMALVVTDETIDGETVQVTKYRALYALEAITPVLIAFIDDFLRDNLGEYLAWGPITTDIIYPLFRAQWTVESRDTI